MIVVIMGALLAAPGLATGHVAVSHCLDAGFGVVSIESKPAWVAEYYAPSDAPAAPYGVEPLVPLASFSTLVGATVSHDGTRDTFATHAHTAIVDATTGAIAVDGKPQDTPVVAPVEIGGTPYVDPAIATALLGDGAFAWTVQAAIPQRRWGVPLPVSAACMPTLTAAQKAQLAEAALPYPPRSEQTFWCTPEDYGPFDATDPYVNQKLIVASRASKELCNGNDAAAAADYRKALPGPGIGKSGSDQVVFTRAFTFAETFGGDPDAARAHLPSPSPELRAFFAGNVCASIKGYVADDAKVWRTPDGRDAYAKAGPDPHLAAVARAACTGDLDGAVAQIASLRGAHSLYDLIAGDLFAARRNWGAAARAWRTAAFEYPDVPMMEFLSEDQWNDEALWMIYYYRAHMPRT